LGGWDRTAQRRTSLKPTILDPQFSAQFHVEPAVWLLRGSPRPDQLAPTFSFLIRLTEVIPFPDRHPEWPSLSTQADWLRISRRRPLFYRFFTWTRIQGVFHVKRGNHPPPLAPSGTLVRRGESPRLMIEKPVGGRWSVPLKQARGVLPGHRLPTAPSGSPNGSRDQESPPSLPVHHQLLLRVDSHFSVCKR
jgi:hypothetical protein